MYLLAEFGAERSRYILLHIVCRIIVPDDDTTALHKLLHHEAQRSLVSIDRFALLVELLFDGLLESILASHRLRLEERKQVDKRFIDGGDGEDVLWHR